MALVVAYEELRAFQSHTRGFTRRRYTAGATPLALLAWSLMHRRTTVAVPATGAQTEASIGAGSWAVECECSLPKTGPVDLLDALQ